MDFRKQAKESRTKKLHQLTVSAPDAKTDASDFTPYADPNMDKKTGKRPINPRNFKRGGKVAALDGAKAAKRGDRMGAKGRKAKQVGGEISTEDRARLTAMAEEASKARPSAQEIKSTKDAQMPLPSRRPQEPIKFRAKEDIKSPYKKGGRTKKMMGGDITAGGNPQIPSARGNTSLIRKAVGLDYEKGGKVKKMNGGPMMAGPAQTLMKRKTPMNNPAAKAPAVMPMRAKGGKVHSDEAMDKALIKKMVKPEARKKKMCGGRTKKDDGGGAGMRSEYTQQAKAGRKSLDRIYEKVEADRNFERAKRDFPKNASDWAMSDIRVAEALAERAKRRSDNASKKNVDTGQQTGYSSLTGYPVTERETYGRASERLRNSPVGFGEDEEMKRGGRAKKRAQRASGGRAKGKSNINIVIAPQPAAQGPMPMGGMPPRPPMPMPMPPAPGGMPPGAMPPGAGGMPMPIPMPMAGGAPAPAPQGAGVPGLPGMAPLPRKSGGRIKSYKDMTAGAGSGEGRLQKEEMQEYKRTARKAGGKVPNMTFGAGSGPGRIEKIHAYGENPHGEAAPKPQKRSYIK